MTQEPDGVLDQMLASHLVAPVLADSFDRAVLTRLDEELLQEPDSSAGLRALAERERAAALGGLAARLWRWLGATLLDLAGLAALVWAAWKIVPSLAGLAVRFTPALPAAGFAGMPVLVAVLVLAAGYLIARVQRSA